MSFPVEQLSQVIREEVELNTARMVTRIAGIVGVNLKRQTHPEAIAALQQVQSQIEMFSLVFAPAAKDHPLTRTATTAPRPAQVPQGLVQTPASRPEIRVAPRPTPLPVSEPVQPAKKSLKDRLLDLHREQPTLTRAQLAEQLNCSLASIHMWARDLELDIPRPTKAKKPRTAKPRADTKAQQVIALHQAEPELTRQQLADKVGCSLALVHQTFAKHQLTSPRPAKAPKVKEPKGPTLADQVEALHREQPTLKRQQLAGRIGCSLALVHQTFAKRQLKVVKVANVVRYLPPVRSNATPPKPRPEPAKPIFVPPPAPTIKAKPVDHAPKPEVTNPASKSLANAMFVYPPEEERILLAHTRNPKLNQFELARQLSVSTSIVAFTFRKAKSIRDPRLVSAR